ncbi:MAG TPA: nucleotide exchange factor GrpE [Anaerolineae bacterium]|nr:nucleotide exchange factor GrpE [Anaerolineae bacterium]
MVDDVQAKLDPAPQAVAGSDTAAPEVQSAAAEAGPAAEAAGAPGDAPDLRAEIERLKAEATANLDGWQRALAEFANYKRRSEAERSQLAFLVGVKIIEKLLPIVDDFDRAMANLPADLRGNGWVEGVSLTRRKLASVLEDEGVTPIAVAPGDAFDPSLHEAVTHEASEQFEAGQIIAELQPGYRIGERVLRPSLVRVAR